MSLSFRIPDRASDLDASIDVLSSTDAPASSSVRISLRCHHLRSTLASEAGSSATPDITSAPDLRSKRSIRLVSYRLDTPTSPAVARRCRRLVSDCDHERPSLHGRERPVQHASVGAFHDVAAAEPIPADPARQEVRVPLDSQRLLLRSHITVQRACGASTSGISRDPVGVRCVAARTRWKSQKPAWTSGAAGVSPRRRRPSMLTAKHRRPGEAGHSRGEPKLSSSDHQLLLAASTTNRRHQPELCNCRLDTTE
jgi:hypothetical protein